MRIWLVYTDQLFEATLAAAKSADCDRIWLVDHPLFYDRYTYHYQKLLYQKASSYAFEAWLKSKKFPVKYTEYSGTDSSDWFGPILQSGATEIHLFYPPNIRLLEELTERTQEAEISLHVREETPMFLRLPKELCSTFSGEKKTTHYNFYKAQRQRFKVLLTKEGKPLGGEWRLDDENRERYCEPLDDVPELPNLTKKDREYYNKAKKWLNGRQIGQDAYGTHDGLPCYPVSFSSAKRWFNNFLNNRLRDFGPYQDAIVPSQSFLFHSVISCCLNNGLLTPEFVVERTQSFAASADNIPLNSLEGFLAQILGWREMMLGVYLADAPQYDASDQCIVPNHFGFKRSLPEAFWTGDTGVELLDTTIGKLLDTAYLHHIERLMVTGSFMLMCEFNPQDVFSWYSALFVDAYDWVMYGNVMMSQFNDGGALVARKPYISSYNYIEKMTCHYEHTEADRELWDALFWRFLDRHKKALRKTAFARNLGQLSRRRSELPGMRKRVNKFLTSL